MRSTTHITFLMCAVFFAASLTFAQQAGSSSDSKPAQPRPDNDAHAYSGMYSFLKEGEFMQVTVEDAGHVTGFISRYGDGESDKGAFLDQFFKTGKLEGNKLAFTTEMVHGVTFDFDGTVDRGDGKSRADEAYFVIKGALTEKSTDVNKKVTAQTHSVVFKMFPEEAAPAPSARQ
jgi:hypothetical protein